MPPEEAAMAVRPPQHIAVFQQMNSGEAKIAGIRRYGGKRFRLECFAIDRPLPPVLDDTRGLLPEALTADLVLDYLRHPDLSEDLAALCARASIPVIAPGRKIRYAISPPTCCGLAPQEGLGAYGRLFGAPSLEVEVVDGRLAAVRVLRGAPCGATWAAAAKMIGHPLDDAPTRMGLEVQFFCSADPAGWDPLYGHSPVHFAGHVHRTALAKALARPQK
jgi:hypothetical protein